MKPLIRETLNALAFLALGILIATAYMLILRGI